MNRFFSSLVLVLLAATAPAQTPATPAPRATPPRQRLNAGATEKQILEFGSFELPRVKGRTPKAKGGNFLLFTTDEWQRFHGDVDASQGTLTVGLTDEVSRTGRQSMYVEFKKLTKQSSEAELSSQLVRIAPEKPYHISIWGRMDKKQALPRDQRLPALRLLVDFFQEDGETQTGDQIARVQPIPGSPNLPPFFNTANWREYYADVTTPEDAVFMKITWSWTTPPTEGETNGVIYFDDATLFGEKVEEPETPEPAPDAAPAAPVAPVAPGPAAAPVPAPAPK